MGAELPPPLTPVLCFPSALDAVNCALAAQTELRADPDLTLRVGIHLEDVIFEEGDLLSPDPEQAFFADGLAEDLITRLASWRAFPAIGCNSTIEGLPHIRRLRAGVELDRGREIEDHALVSTTRSRRARDASSNAEETGSSKRMVGSCSVGSS